MRARTSAGSASPTARKRLRLAATLISATLAACGRSEAPAPAAAGRPVASVGGRPVPAAWVAAAARDGEDPADALERVVETAVLARRARDRGWDGIASRRAERRSLLVRRLLRREAEFGDEPTERDLADLRRLYEEHRSWFVHPELRMVEHVAVLLADPRARRSVDRPPEAWELGRATLESIVPLASGALDGEAFGGLREVVERRLRAGWAAAGLVERQAPPVVQERIGPFEREGAYDPAFLAAAFALESPGDVSAPVRTAYGWHVLYLAEVQPPRDDDFAAAAPEILEKARAQVESERAASLAAAAAVRLGVRPHADRLPLTFGRGEAPGP